MQIGEFKDDNLIAGDFPRVTDWLNIPSGTLKRGAIVQADGSAYISGSGSPYAVISKDVDATTSAQQAAVYLTGEFSNNHLIKGDGSALSSTDIAALRRFSIFVKTTIPA